MIVDLRSDTVTRPTPAMRQAMMAAPVGDDVFGDDPTVNQLEAKLAALFGKEAALFVPSGTMSNQIAIKVHTQPMTEVVCAADSHVYLYEGGGIMYNSGASVKLLAPNRGRITWAQVQAAINPDDVHFPATRLVSLENTANRGGGACYDFEEIVAIRAVCDAHNLALHLDGARLFNALMARGETPAQYGKVFDTISICLSKGLGAPVGSVLLGKAAHIKAARRVRKALGGGWRQAGILAAAGIYALDHHVERLADDHRRSAHLGELLKHHPAVAELLPVETNIVLFRTFTPEAKTKLMAHLKAHDVWVGGFGPDWIRFVLHLDVDDAAVEKTDAALKAFTV